MSDAATAETTVETPAKGKRGRPPKKFTLTKAEIDALVEEKVSQRLGNEPYKHEVATPEIEARVSELVEKELEKIRAANPSTATYPREKPRRFLEWNPLEAPPEGYQKIPMNNGTTWLENLPPENFEPEIKRLTLEKVDAAYRTMLIPTDEHPVPKPPKRLVVNRAWRKLFENVMAWGDTAVIEIDMSAFENNDVPQFKFERE